MIERLAIERDAFVGGADRLEQAIDRFERLPVRRVDGVRTTVEGKGAGAVAEALGELTGAIRKARCVGVVGSDLGQLRFVDRQQFLLQAARLGDALQLTPGVFVGRVVGEEARVGVERGAEVGALVFVHAGDAREQALALVGVLRVEEANLQRLHHLLPVDPGEVDRLEDLGRARAQLGLLEHGLQLFDGRLDGGVDGERGTELFQRAIESERFFRATTPI